MDSPWIHHGNSFPAPWDQGAQLNLGRLDVLTRKPWRDMKVNGVGIIHPISDYPIYEMENNGNFKKEMFETTNQMVFLMVCPFTWALSTLSRSVLQCPEAPATSGPNLIELPNQCTELVIGSPVRVTTPGVAAFAAFRELLGTPKGRRKADRLQDLKSSVPNGVKNLTIPIRSNNIRYV